MSENFSPDSNEAFHKYSISFISFFPLSLHFVIGYTVTRL